MVNSKRKPTRYELMRRQCMACKRNDEKAIETCENSKCGCWESRFGVSFDTHLKHEEKLKPFKARQQCLKCAGNASAVKECGHEDCPNFTVRFGCTADDADRWVYRQDKAEPEPPVTVNKSKPKRYNEYELARERCLSCKLDDERAVADCDQEQCRNWRSRFGVDPDTERRHANLQYKRMRERCLRCQDYDEEAVAQCVMTECACWKGRFGCSPEDHETREASRLASLERQARRNARLSDPVVKQAMAEFEKYYTAKRHELFLKNRIRDDGDGGNYD